MAEQTTSNVDVDFKQEQVVEQSHAPATAGGNSALPTVGTNAKSQWSTWDPNQWWTDWNLPQDPRPSWELWFDWVKQLKNLVPAINEAGNDWQTLVNQFDTSLQQVRGMRADIGDWTGPSAQTMSDSLDKLENSITTKANAIRQNPGKLQMAAQVINDAVAPMTELDAEYQKVLQDLNACRQVALRGRPIMLNLAKQLLQTGTDLENSVQTDNLAPQPTPPAGIQLSDGQQGPGQQFASVAGSSGLTDPGMVGQGNQVAVANAPTVAGASGVTDPGMVGTAQGANLAHTPGVAVSPGGQNADVAMPTGNDASVTATPTLAGSSAGTLAPVPAMPAAGAAPMGGVPSVGGAGPTVMPMAPMTGMGGGTLASAPTVASAGTSGSALPTAPTSAGRIGSNAPQNQPQPQQQAGHSTEAVPVAVPLMAPPVAGRAGASGSVAVPSGLAGRTGGGNRKTVITGVPEGRRGKRETLRLRDEADAQLDTEAFDTPDGGSGVVAARPPRA